ncbi:MAG: excinuclease ABC subunit UvrC [Bacteroidota bacterium]|nr:excinuclease ABC subunit UvrC [Bacteroidota bacterium]
MKDFSHLKDTISSLPLQPGVYKYFDDLDNIIYVGKAKHLKKRVSSYFVKAHDNRKTNVLVSKIKRIEYTVVDTEYDALLLENLLIKELQPRYNINLKDDKSYPYIKITKGFFPKIFVVRNPIKDGSEYIGPYANKKMMNTVLELALKLYPTRNCNLNLTPKSIGDGKFSVCLEYQIGNCKGPCQNYQSETDYNQSIVNIKHILKGNLSVVKKHLKLQIEERAAILAFEEAHEYKQKLDWLENYQSKSTIVSHTISNVDVFGMTSTPQASYINYLRVNNGMIVQSQNLEIKKKIDETDVEILQNAIAQFKNMNPTENEEFIVPFKLDLETNFPITIPLAGDKKKLLDLSIKNALVLKLEKQQNAEKLDPDLRVERVLTVMKEDLRLKELPKHIECFDNSNIQGTNPVSACVVFRNAKPSKNDYRHFNIKTVIGPNDFASMQEVLTRRYSRMLAENTELPNLIVIDGGKGQLSASVQALKKLGIYEKVAIIGIAKRLEEIYYPGDTLPLYLDKKSETLKIIQQMRDEAHRFGITHHRNRRSKGFTITELTEIDGIGDKTADLLLKHFKSLKKIKEASLEQISIVVGNKAAENIFYTYHPNV